MARVPRSTRRRFAGLLGLALLATPGCEGLQQILPLLSRLSSFLGPVGSVIPMITGLVSSLPIAQGEGAGPRALGGAAEVLGAEDPGTALNSGRPDPAARDTGGLPRDDSPPAGASPGVRTDPGAGLRTAARVATRLPGVGATNLGRVLGVVGS